MDILASELAETLLAVMNEVTGRPANGVRHPDGHMIYTIGPGEVPDGMFNSGETIAYADALRLLGKVGLVKIVDDDGGNGVTAVSITC